jgi:hypothetical protein
VCVCVLIETVGEWESALSVPFREAESREEMDTQSTVMATQWLYRAGRVSWKEPRDCP